MATLTMMIGYPRSGKSTWIKNNKGDRLVIEPDWIRREILGHQFHIPAEPMIWVLVDSFIRIALSQNKDIILDGINLVPFIRSKYIKLAKSMNCEVDGVWVRTPIEECIQRNEESLDGKKLPTESLDSMRYRFVEPKSKDFNNLYIVDQHKV
jgi:predicted kinase